MQIQTIVLLSLAYFPSSLSVCLWVCVSVQSSVIKPRQSSPEQSEDVAKAHNVLQIYRPGFDLFGPCSVARIQRETASSESSLLRKRPGEMFS